MKKTELLLVSIALIASYCLKAQVVVTKDNSIADATAMFEVKSKNKGVLIPRMTKDEIRSIQNPADGLQVYNIDDGKNYIYVSLESVWKEIEYGDGTIHSPARYSIGITSVSVNLIVNSYYGKGVPLDSSNSVTFDATVVDVGSWNINTDTINGYSFSGSGNFKLSGIKQVTLYGKGTPLAIQTDNFTATMCGAHYSCDIPITVVEAIPTVINPITGKIWMDRNLGASRAAINNEDEESYGDLYQWGRATEGHELKTCLTTSTKASTATPFAGNSWDGLFIKSNKFPDDWLIIQDSTLWQGPNGTNNPCPAGFRIPTIEEWIAEMESWDSQDFAGAFGSNLKLVNSGYHIKSSDLPEGQGQYGYYWSSSTHKTVSHVLLFNKWTIARINTAYRSQGLSVRCIKD